MNIHFPLAHLSAFVQAYDQSDFFGKLVILGLVSLSALCWVLLLYKIWITRQVQGISKIFHQACLKHKDQLLHMELAHLPKPQNTYVPHPFAKIFLSLKNKTVEILNKNMYFSQKDPEKVYLSGADLEIIESFVLTTISSQAKALEKNLYILSTIVTLGPFLGLLGTVWGILITFAELHSGGTAGSNTAVLGGLSTALATTVLGLVIAIPALVAYNYLKTAIRNYASDMEDFLYELLSSIELQYRRADVG